MEDIGIYHLKAFIILELCFASTNDRKNSTRGNLNTEFYLLSRSPIQSALLLIESRLKKWRNTRQFVFCLLPSCSLNQHQAKGPHSLAAFALGTSLTVSAFRYKMSPPTAPPSKGVIFHPNGK